MSILSAIALLAAAAAVPAATAVEAPGPSGPLRGTMLSPAGGAAPIILIIPGSGPTDRDGNNPLGVTAAPYRLLAEALAERGVATVRIDKRGLFGSAGAVPDANATTIADYVADVRSWVSAIRARTGVGCVWLLGHSEGGLIALAAREIPDACGLMLVSAPGRRVGEPLREQLRAIPAFAPMLDQAMAAIASLEAGRRVDAADLPAALQPLFAPQLQGFLISLFSYDPAAMLAGYDRPTLILLGQRDIQIGEQDARRLAAANPRARLVLLPDVNHVLKTVTSDDRAANIAAYSDPSLPIAPGVVAAIADFATSGSARPAPAGDQ